MRIENAEELLRNLVNGLGLTHWADAQGTYNFWPELEKARKAIEMRDRLEKFLDHCAGEGLVMDGVDAGDLYIELFPKEFELKSGSSNEQSSGKV